MDLPFMRKLSAVSLDQHVCMAKSSRPVGMIALSKVERRSVIGAAWRFEKALSDSEDSSKLNTSFIERLNLTIRQGSAYLFRRTICHARWKERLEGRCYYNFVRPHRALKFGPEIRTPAMQAGLISKRLSFREVFVAAPESILL